MGQKVHPYGFRLVSIRKPRSRWFAEGARYRQQLIEDVKIREYIHDRERNAGVSDVIIEFLIYFFHNMKYVKSSRPDMYHDINYCRSAQNVSTFS